MSAIRNHNFDRGHYTLPHVPYGQLEECHKSLPGNGVQSVIRKVDITMTQKKLNLVQVTHDLNIGGLQQVVVNLCRALNRDLFNITVLCLREKGPFTQELEDIGINVHLIEQKEDGADYLAFFKVAKFLRENEVDVIHTHNTQPFFDGTIGAALAGVRTVIHTDHARSFPDKMRYMVAEKLMSFYAYKVVGCSEHTSHNLVKYEKISPRKITTVTNGIWGEKFNIELDVPSYKEKLGIKKDGPVLGICVRFTEQKGITYLLKAMPKILEKHPGTTLFIGGEGELEEEHKKEAEALGLQNDVIFGGPRFDIPELLKVFDLYMLPSLWEGLPMVILEAMAAGCPIVATDVGGNSRAIIDGESGFLVEPKKPGVFAEAVNKLLDDQNLIATFAEKGKALFDEHFSAKTMADAYTKLYFRNDEHLIAQLASSA